MLAPKLAAAADKSLAGIVLSVARNNAKAIIVYVYDSLTLSAELLNVSSTA